MATVTRDAEQVQASSPSIVAPLVERLLRLDVPEGIVASALPGVELFRSSADHECQPMLYRPSMVVVVQGSKRGYLGGDTLVYGAGRYLMVPIVMPFECESLPDAPELPVLGLSIDLDVAVLGELLVTMDERPDRPVGTNLRAMYAAAVDDVLADALSRLLDCLAVPADAVVLGPQIVREILYRVLRGPHSDGLRALVAINGRLARLQPVIADMHASFSEPVEVAALARRAGMSVTSFHTAFQALTSTSPLQYLKAIRLHEARLLMARDGLGAAESATVVGYASATQFSREFRRFFGRPPLSEARRLREAMALDD